MYGTGAGLVPRGFLFRAFWTSVTATVGYIYYQVNQASSWVAEKSARLRELGMEGMLGLIDVWESAAASIEGHGLGVQEDADGHFGGTSEDDHGHTTNKSVDLDSASGQFRDFIKKMIEVRNILKSAEMDNTLNLPSIVVIGSQSSGKSSVLESIVGHEFLPKGNNMVTRRPLELTLVNSPTCTRDFAVFNQLETGPVFDFSKVQQTLTDLNLAVPEDQWISPKPIELTIYSKNVPDLSLVDLPGYIQINNRNQPPILRDRIAQLCEQYIKQDNIILAVCPADVDLANAEALKASRAVDPEGLRTIGVITKLDLVDPEYSAHLIQNEDYPLRLGYVGVVCRPPATQTQPRALSILTRSKNTHNERYEDLYVSEHQEAFEKIKDRVGISRLRDRLSSALETSMAESLSGVFTSVQDELSELCYIMKVEYSDRVISPEGYVSYLATSVKNGLESVAKDYSRPRVREQLRKVLHKRLIEVADETIWKYSDKAGLLDEAQLNQAVASLTRSGVGRIAANCLVDAIITQVSQIIKDGPLSHHPAAKERLLKQAETAMRRQSQAAIEQVENAIKPLKSEMEYTDDDWIMARKKIIHLFEETGQDLERTLKKIQSEVGQRRLVRIVQHLHEPKDGSVKISQNLVDKAKEAVRINHQLKSIRQRLEVMERKECMLPDVEGKKRWFHFGSDADTLETVKKNISVTVDAGTPDAKTIHVWNHCQTRCPEVYLYLVMEKLLSTSALYVHHELVHEFLHPFPDELAASLSTTPNSGDGVMGLDRKEILEFVQENASVARHLQLQERRRILEKVRDKLAYLQHFNTNTIRFQNVPFLVALHFGYHVTLTFKIARLWSLLQLDALKSTLLFLHLSLLLVGFNVAQLDIPFGWRHDPDNVYYYFKYLNSRLATYSNGRHASEVRQISSNRSLGHVTSSSDIFKFAIYGKFIMRWRQLEGDAEVLSLYGGELGLAGRFEDIPSLEIDVAKALVEQLDECNGIVMVAPVTFLAHAPLSNYTGSAVLIEQSIDNACGAIALYHLLANTSTNQLAVEIQSLPDPTARGKWLETKAALHERFAAMGQTELPDLSDETELHFICIIKRDGHAIWFDGRKKHPMKIDGTGEEFTLSYQAGPEESEKAK
ncbi:Mgm1p [Paramicrosporidium saccamoebae]|uniref:ubiquitinyl hydrolase 1 n=1 Tax=Paramicrosporidium saccamoebae TaxID=1246581 RepID=A0A2H9TPC9_9FUNG|nr:Mgm1p [Paramicrosporidium saccamoebae]